MPVQVVSRSPHKISEQYRESGFDLSVFVLYFILLYYLGSIYWPAESDLPIHRALSLGMFCRSGRYVLQVSLIFAKLVDLYDTYLKRWFLLSYHQANLPHYIKCLFFSINPTTSGFIQTSFRASGVNHLYPMNRSSLRGRGSSLPLYFTRKRETSLWMTGAHSR